MPMAAMLAHASARGALSTRPQVVVVQRASATSGWKVEAINSGRSPIGGIEPELDRIVRTTVDSGVLRATHHTRELADADVVLVCTQTDRDGIGPDYGPLMSALDELTTALRARPRGNVPLVIFESTLAPSSTHTVVREAFARRGLIEGRDVLLGNSPNRVMPGRLVERVTTSDKLAAGLDPATPSLIARLYRTIVTRGAIHETNSLTAEIVKTLENAYRDVRIAFSTEVVRYCDARQISFYELRQRVNDRLGQQDTASSDANAVPTGGLLIPTIGVGGHCLPKDGILLCWRRSEREANSPNSLLLEARRINSESPTDSIRLAEQRFGSMAGRRVALLGTAYRFNSEDTRNSPTLPLASALLDRGADVVLHDPYVYPTDQNLERTGLSRYFTRDLDAAVDGAEYLFICVAHRAYSDSWDEIRGHARRALGIFDGSNFSATDVNVDGIPVAGIGRGGEAPDPDLVDEVVRAFRAVEAGVANELAELIDLLNADYASGPFNRADLNEVRRLAATCTTGCAIPEPRPVREWQAKGDFASRLVRCAREATTLASATPAEVAQ
jgi:UDP-N-acetyl-D-mannosaminuronic acid dehydrogenase